MTVKQLLGAIKVIADPNLASEWDNAGLQVGNPGGNITKILLGMDVTTGMLDYAAANGFNTIVVHHPLIFKPLKNIDYDSALGALLSKAISSQINIISAHTNLDHVDWGVSRVLAEYIGLKNLKPIKYLNANYLVKLAVFVPQEAIGDVRSAICEAGGGIIGDYSYCTFSSPGQGTFFGGESAKPHIGKAGQLEKIDEHRLEVLVEKNILNDVVSSMEKAHPYEEVAYDIYPLLNTKNYGVGCLGEFNEARKVSEIAGILKTNKWVNCIGLISEKMATVSKVAVCGGSAGSIIEHVVNSGAEMLICGELGYHAELTATEKGLNIILLGHAQSEAFVLDVLKARLQNFSKNTEFEIYDNIYPGPRWEYFDEKH